MFSDANTEPTPARVDTAHRTLRMHRPVERDGAAVCLECGTAWTCVPARWAYRVLRRHRTERDGG